MQKSPRVSKETMNNCPEGKERLLIANEESGGRVIQSHCLSSVRTSGRLVHRVSEQRLAKPNILT